MTIKELISKAEKLLEYHKATNENKNCDKCQQSIEKKPYYSFTMKAIQGKSELYEVLSKIVNDTDISSNYTYQWLYYALSDFTDTLDDNATIEELENLDLMEMTDSSIDVYTNNLTEWLANSVYHQYYVDQAIDEYDCKETSKALMVGQGLAIQEIYETTRQGLVEFYKTIEDEEETRGIE